MKTQLNHLFAAPVFKGDNENTWKAGLLNAIINISLLIMTLVIIGNIIGGRTPTIVFIVDGLMVGAIVLTRVFLINRKLILASILMTSMATLVVAAAAASLGTIRTPTTSSFIVIIIIAGLLFEKKGVVITTITSSLVVLGLIVAENMGLLPKPDYNVTISQWITYTTLFGFTGVLIYFLFNSRVQALERELNEIEKRKLTEGNYRLLINNIPDVTWTSDSSGKTTFISPNVKTVYGYAPDELYRGGEKLWFGRVYPDDLHILKKSYKNLFEQDMEFDIEYRIRRKDGQWIWLHDRAIMHYEKDKKKYAFGIFSDITERKQAEKKLIKSEERFKIIFHDAPGGYYLSDLKGTFIDGNKAAEIMLGYKKEELLGKNFLKLGLLPSKHFPKAAKLLARNALGKSTGPDEFTLIRKDGSTLEVEISTHPVRIEGKTLVLGITSDITERKQAVVKIEEALINARNANDVKDQFIANISHEIRTPLNSILGFSDLLNNKYADKINKKDSEIFNYINSASNRLLRTVDAILNISELVAGSIHIRPHQFDLNELVISVIQELKPYAEQKNLKLLCKTSKLPIQVYADKYSIEQVLVNLTENAIKYTQEGRVEIVLFKKKDHPMLSINDTGIGISDEYRERIFEPYTQESEGFTKDYQGIGLGLALTSRYLELNNVKLDFVSSKGVGSTFTLTFPIFEENVNG
ncbi:MAG: PAS domain-containing sensor histidine kinase [FCB group bacterium]|nr:PAS domain-containing sensor histidine kinase [FCB group bacterium]MBL7029422.1 PAS domain-containing sensor histidine kinase [Candidatus Neomarinimicrobiota bacterium]